MFRIKYLTLAAIFFSLPLPMQTNYATDIETQGKGTSRFSNIFQHLDDNDYKGVYFSLFSLTIRNLELQDPEDWALKLSQRKTSIGVKGGYERIMGKKWGWSVGFSYWHLILSDFSLIRYDNLEEYNDVSYNIFLIDLTVMGILLRKSIMPFGPYIGLGYGLKYGNYMASKEEILSPFDWLPGRKT